MKSLRQMLIERAREPTDPQPRLGLNGIPDAADPLVRRAVLLMEQHLGQRVPVARLAEGLRVSERQLQRAFETSLGASPAAYARRLRLQHARWLITSTRKAVTEIALECGFADASHFGRWYRREFSVSPLGHRRGSVSIATSSRRSRRAGRGSSSRWPGDRNARSATGPVTTGPPSC